MANRLRKMRVKEVSLVTRPANQFAEVLVAKNETDGDDGLYSPLLKGDCPDCGGKTFGSYCPKCKSKVAKSDPGATEVHVPSTKWEKKRVAKPTRQNTGAKGDIVMPQIDKSALDPVVSDYITKLEDSVLDLQAQVEEQDVSKSDDGGLEVLLKSADPALVEYIKGIESKASGAEEMAKALAENLLDKDVLAKSASLAELGTPEEIAPVLKAARLGLSEEDFAKVDALLTKANGMIESGRLFTEIGKSVGEVSEVDSRIDKAAEALRAEDPTLTQAQAVAKALDANPALYREYMNQEG